MPAFKKGDHVKLVQPVIQGEVIERRIIDDEDHFVVAFTDANGAQEQVFSENQLEAV